MCFWGVSRFSFEFLATVSLLVGCVLFVLYSSLFLIFFDLVWFWEIIVQQVLKVAVVVPGGCGGALEPFFECVCR